MPGRQRSPKIDIVGLTILLLSLGFGGSLMRDVLVGDAPSEALRHWWYIAMVGLAGVVIVGFSIRVIAERMGLRTRPMRPIDE